MKTIMSVFLNTIAFICLGVVIPKANIKEWLILIFAAVLFSISGMIIAYRTND